MEKILIGSYQCESNTFAEHLASKEEFETAYGEAVLAKLAATKVFLDNGFTPVPMVFAKALPSGKVKKADFLEILQGFLQVAEENADAKGVYIFFHGAMQVEYIGSGEEYCIKELRKLLGNAL